jgi:nicotinate-nucleotide adenylyltransferase
MRLALFGGSFDPIHRGHLAIAVAAADAFDLDRVLFAPVGHQPLKPEGASADFSDRLAMVTIACASDSRFVGSALDAPRADNAPNYTVDTLAALAEDFPDAKLFVLTGADSFLELRRWRSPERLLELAEWIVVSRPGSPLTEQQLASLELTEVERARIHLLTTVHEDVSASGLRRRLADGEPSVGMLPPGVESYIQTHGLYR